MQDLSKICEELLRQGKIYSFQKYYELTVGVDCIFCGKFTPAKSKKKLFCEDCKVKWENVTPKYVKEELRLRSSFDALPTELAIWKRIIDFRNREPIESYKNL